MLYLSLAIIKLTTQTIQMPLSLLQDVIYLLKYLVTRGHTLYLSTFVNSHEVLKSLFKLITWLSLHQTIYDFTVVFALYVESLYIQGLFYH